LPGTPLAFLLTGFTWLSGSFLLGIALIIGLVYGTPLPQGLKPVHVHGTLVGGILQLAIGALLCSIARSSDRKDAYAETRPALFVAFNGATAALLVGFWLRNMLIAGLAGLVLTVIVLSLFKTSWIHVTKACLAGWIYRIALAALLGGLAAGISIAFRLTDGYYAHVRLAHIHLIVLGFLTIVFVVALHQLLPALLQTLPREERMTKFALWSLPLGFALLLVAFLMSAIWLQIVVGCLLIASIGFYTFQLLTTWLKAGSPGTAASDHLLIGAFFLVLTIATGLAMSANYVQNPPLLPIGSLHLVAYTHLAFIGFITQVICGSLSFFVPQLLSTTRVQNHAKQEVYRTQLDAIMNRWRWGQLAGLSLGTMALCVLASLTWSVPLGSAYVQISMWTAVTLLVLSLALFVAKLSWAIGLRPT
jgi:hypothetical protein